MPHLPTSCLSFYSKTFPIYLNLSIRLSSNVLLNLFIITLYHQNKSIFLVLKCIHTSHQPIRMIYWAAFHCFSCLNMVEDYLDLSTKLHKKTLDFVLKLRIIQMTLTILTIIMTIMLLRKLLVQFPMPYFLFPALWKNYLYFLWCSLLSLIYQLFYSMKVL